MMKVILIEDDKNVREYLKTIIDWNKEGFILSGEASNGKKGLETLFQVKPEIVILDIEMPVMNGIEFMKRLNDLKINTKVIVLSCHDEFEYVKDAMKLGAADYILKHRMNNQDILNILNNVRKSIEEEKSSYKGIIQATKGNEHLREEMNNSVDLVKEKILLDIAKGIYLTREELLLKLKALGIEPGSFIVTTFGIDYLNIIYKGKNDSFVNSLDEAILKIIKRNIGSFSKTAAYTVDKGYFMALIRLPDEKKSLFEIRKLVFEVVSRIQQDIQEALKFTISSGLSEICCDYMKIPNQWNQAKAAISYKFYRGTNKILFYNEIPNFGGPEQVNFKICELKANIHNKNDSERILEELFISIVSSNIEPGKFQRILYSIINIFTNYLESNNLGIEDAFEGSDFLYKALENFETLNEFKIWCADLYGKVCTAIEEKSQKRFRKEIREAIKYIKENYARSIPLDEVADYVSISKAYFSQIFKKETGENFSNFLVRYRLEKARELLIRDEMKVYSIAYAVGFQSHHYFNNIFKEYYGTTPNQFRQMNAGK